MKLINELVAAAQADDQMMGELAQKEAGNMERRHAYEQLEATFQQMASDGYLDQNELDSLMRQFRAQGLDTSQIQKLLDQLKGTDGATRVSVDATLREKIGNELFQAKAETNDPFFAFQAQTLMADYHNRLDAASRASKAEHDIYMVAIKHLAG